MFFDHQHAFIVQNHFEDSQKKSIIATERDTKRYGAY